MFRYFPTKEDLVLLDHSPAFLETLAAAPAELGPVQAMRFTMQQIVAAQSPEQLVDDLERERMILTVPELWAAGLTNVTGVIRSVEEIFAARAGRESGDPAIRNITGAILGVALAAWLDWVRRPELDGMAEMDRALAHLESGLDLGIPPRLD